MLTSISERMCATFGTGNKILKSLLIKGGRTIATDQEEWGFWCCMFKFHKTKFRRNDYLSKKTRHFINLNVILQHEEYTDVIQSKNKLRTSLSQMCYEYMTAFTKWI